MLFKLARGSIAFAAGFTIGVCEVVLEKLGVKLP